jgi:S1-C subfamily serine protease
MRTMIVGGVLAAGLLAGCSGGEAGPGPVISTPQELTPTATSDSAAENGLPPAVARAAQAVVSIEVRSGVTHYVNAQGDVIGEGVKGVLADGSGTYIGQGRVLTANHVGAEYDQARQTWGAYHCFGNLISGQGASAEAQRGGSYFKGLGDIAILQSPDFRYAAPPTAALTTEDVGAEQRVYFANFQSLDTNEHSSVTIRNPLADDPEMTKPAIFSGVAKRSPKGEWIILTGKDITTEYGSGQPTRMTPGGSGGALFNEQGELLAVTTAVSDLRQFTPSVVQEVTSTSFTTVPSNEKYWIQYGTPVDTATVTSLERHERECEPGPDDAVIPR